MSERRGYVCIINTIRGRDRRRCELDEQNLVEAFGRLGAEVDTIIRDPTNNEVSAKMDELAEKDWTNILYVAIVYCSHGGEDNVVAINDPTLNEYIMKLQQAILVPLCKIKALDKKLKMLITQTCRGAYDFIRLEADGAEPGDFFPAYYAKLYATTEGVRAWNVNGIGSIFIDALCRRLNRTDDLVTIMENTTEDVKQFCKTYNLQNEGNEGILQVPSIEHNLGARLFCLGSEPL